MTGADDFDATPATRVPPHSLEAEQALLGGLMLDDAAFDRVHHLVTAAAFYRREHRAVYEVIASLNAACKTADMLSVFEAAKGHEDARHVPLTYLNQLCQSTTTAAHVRRYAEIVAEHAATRQLIAAADEVAQLGFDASVPLAEKVEKAGALLSAVNRGQVRKAPRLLAELLGPACDRYSELQRGEVKAGIATGIAPLDRLLNGGLKGGKLIGVAARPSVGKSSVARAIALAAAQAGAPTLVLSQEMPVDELTDCFIAQVGHIDGSHLQTGELEAFEWASLTEAVDVLTKLPLHVDDEGGLTVADVAAKARMVPGLKLIVVDYLQLMSSSLKNKNATRAEQVAEMSGGLKRLALQMGVPIVVLSQLNRGVEMRQDREPQLSDLRESGAIEQDLDIAVLLWTVKQDPETRLVGWKVAKQRGGRLGVFGMRFKPATYSWFVSDESLKSAPAPRSSGGFDD